MWVIFFYEFTALYVDNIMCNILNILHRCEQKKWGPVETMPDVSVIITFHETESISHLLRTVHSLVQRTPRALLNQIILVADNTHKGSHFHFDFKY